MENKNRDLDNRYICYIYDLYDIVKFNDNTKENNAKKKFYLRKQKNEKSKLKEQLDRIESKKKFILDNIPSFYDLWDFCEFVRILEKVFFFPNSSKDELCVEFDMSGKSKEAKFRIRKINYEIRFALTKSNLLFPAVNNKIEVTVVREYGLKMKNIYTIINEKMNYEDESDLYLINEINFILKKIIHDTFSQAVELIIKDTHKKENSEAQQNYELYEQFGFY